MIWTSLFGIVTIVMLARALGFAKAPVLADVAAAERIAADAIHGFRAVDGVVTRDRRAALVAGQDGSTVLVRPFGDRWVVRPVDRALAEVDGDRLRLRSAEAMVPPADLDLGPAAARWAQRL